MKKIICFLGVLAGICCHNHQTQEVVLEIGSYKLGYAEYSFLKATETYKSLTSEQLESRLLDEGRILAYAIDKKYDTISTINMQLKYASRYYASKVDGYVWNKIVKPLLKVNEKQIDSVLHRRFPGRKYIEGEEIYKNERLGIRDELIQKMKGKFIVESQQHILEDTKPTMDLKGIAELAVKFNPVTKDWTDLHLDMPLMEYFINHHKKFYTASDFMEFVKFQPIFIGSLKKPEDIQEMLKMFLIDEYLFTKAIRMGMDRDLEYLSFKSYYQHKLFLYHYRQENITSRIQLKESDLDNYYNTHSNEFWGFQSSSIQVFRFKNLSSALENQGLVLDWFKRPMMSNKDLLKRKLPAPKILSVNMKAPESHKNLICEIAKLGVGEVSVPTEINGQYWLFKLLSKNGALKMPLAYKRRAIQQLAYDGQLKELYTRNITQLKNTYTVKVNHLKDKYQN